jgi:hypothetical protein
MTINYDPRWPRWYVFRWRLLALGVFALAAIAWLWSLQPIPQPLSYHNFADDRTLLSIPNCLNVISNAPFLLVGLWGTWFVLRQPAPSGSFLQPAERWPFFVFFFAIGVTAFGSAYYHLQPDNNRLVWDRLPMAVAFTSLVAAMIAERIGVKVGVGLLLPLVALGVGSVWYWHVTEQRGHGDLRPYYFVQFYPLLALPLLLLFFPPRYTRTTDLFLALGFYVVAKVCEHPGDEALFRIGHWISGHTLKHLAAAAGAYCILRMIQKRQPDVMMH